MTRKNVQLVFDPGLAAALDPAARTVVCVDQSAERAIPGQSLKEYCGETYADLGREVVFWWQRRFGIPDRDGRSLHDRFEWEGTSPLWWTRNLFLYEDRGIFATLVAAVRTLELFEAGEVDRVTLFGERADLRSLFQARGIPCDPVTPGTSASMASPLRGLPRKLLGLYRRFLQSRILRFRFSRNHRPGQNGTLLYSVIRGEWNPGGHRYLQETLDELLELGEVSEVRPLVYGIPPAFSGDFQWWEFLDRSLRERGGVYPMAYVSFSRYRELRAWAAERCRHLERWLRDPPEPFRKFRGWDFTPLIRAGLADLDRQLERGLVLYEGIQRALRSIRPKGLLLKDEVYPHGRVLIAAARKAGIPTLALQHGSIYPTHWCYLTDPEAQGLARPPWPDTFGVYGPAIAELLSTRNGFPEEILKVVGARRFRELDRMTPGEEFPDLEREGKKRVLVAGQLHQDMPKVYSWLFETVPRHRNLEFVFKPHPRDRQGVAAIEERCLPFENARLFRGPIGEVLPACDLVVSCHSTVLLEAVWLGIGGVSVLVSGEPAAEWQTRAGLLKVVRSRQELQACFRSLSSGELFSDEDREKAEAYLEDYLGRSLVRDRDLLRGLFAS